MSIRARHCVVDGQRVFIMAGNGCILVRVGGEVIGQIRGRFSGHRWIVSPQRGHRWHPTETFREAVEGCYREWKTELTPPGMEGR